MRVLHTYNRLLQERPFLTNSIVGSALAAVGDLVAQRLQQGPNVDTVACARAAATGAAMTGVVTPLWYGWLDAAVPGTSARAVPIKSVADIIVQGGIGNAVAINMRGAPFGEVMRMMPEVLAVDCAIMLPYNLFAFSKLPLHVRPTATAFMTFLLNVYLSSVAGRGRDADAAKQAERELDGT